MSHSARAHARLSPSGAERWLVCPGSIVLSEGIPDKSSSYSRLGTAAHSLAEKCLETGKHPLDLIDEEIVIEDEVFTVDEDMAQSVAVYVDHIREQLKPGVELEIECRLDLSHVIEDSFGSGDALIYDPATKHLQIKDYKHGQGVAVEPEENEQLLTYAVGAIKRYDNRQVDKVTLTVIQPRKPHARGPIRSWETDPWTLVEFQERLREGAELVDEATYNYGRTGDGHWRDLYLTPGDHCTFCKAAPTCPALRERAYELAKAEFSEAGEVVTPTVTDMDSNELAKVLKNVETLKIWLRRVEEFAHAEAVAGRPPTGYKLVAKRATRRWRDAEEAAAGIKIQFDLEDSDIYAAPKMKTPAQVEKIVGKKKFELLSELTVKESSGSVLAPYDDPRPVVRVSAEEEFGG